VSAGARTLAAPSLRLVVGQSARTLFFVALPLALTAYVVYLSLQPNRMYDFQTLWNAGRDVLDGFDGYFVYPAPTAVVMVPFAVLPYAIAAPVFLALVLVSLPLTLAVLGVRDPRCYAVVFLYWPFVASVGNGTISTFLALAVACVWRYRDRRAVAAAGVVAAIISKIFLWPLWFWLVATRRYATAGSVAGMGAAAALAGWAIVGFDEAADYPRLLVDLAGLVQAQSYSAVALGLAGGLSAGLAYVLAAALGSLLLVGVFVAARRPNGEAVALVLALCAALAFSPIVWLHYFVLLLVPIALASPRFSLLWLLPIGYILCAVDSGGDLGMLLKAWAITAAVLGSSLWLLSRDWRNGGAFLDLQAMAATARSLETRGRVYHHSAREGRPLPPDEPGPAKDRLRSLRTEDGVTICDACSIAETPLARMRGLLGRKALGPSEGMLLRPAPSVHTFFMRFPIDAVFLDWDMRVLKIVAVVRPWRIVGCRKARSVLELGAGEAAGRGLLVGDRLELAHRTNGRAPERPTGRREPKIVLAARDPRFLRVATFLLTRAGFAVRPTESLADLVELLRKSEADAVIIDASRRVPTAIRSVAAINSLFPDVGVILVAEPADIPSLAPFPVLEKWSSFDGLQQELENAVKEAQPREVAYGGV
jgi:uncharacterized protein